MPLRDDIETVLRAWDAYEQTRGAPAIIDYDCAPTGEPVTPAGNRLDVHARLTDLHRRALAEDNPALSQRTAAHLAYLDALLGVRTDLDSYVTRTQGCPAAGWPDEYVTAVGDRARTSLATLGIGWGPNTGADLTAAEIPVDPVDAPELIRAAATNAEPAVRTLVGSAAPYTLAIETVDVDAYWSYWLDGAGQNVRLRFNLRNATFTQVRIRQFALHEILGHALQSASYAAHCAGNDVPWVRLLSVHAPHQILLEGLAQALPLFVAAADEPLIARVRLDHYLQLVRAELHQAINTGVTVAGCAAHARVRVPFWDDTQIADILTDRGADPLLRSYLWSYPAGIDWFVTLADTADTTTVGKVFHAAYQQPLTPTDLADLWPAGPPPGGPGTPVRLRNTPVP
ncbi:hypothetical protein [Frankia coriariae]|uniref:DUF885 domain-containing protein n=1 Tax=Protofrankia coriariae TaxID=1562887 RepID=A0ABR5F290_9ACTN|nr:hypothetical protein FrCorBMG51_15650 [Protofrankia coriariae]